MILAVVPFLGWALQVSATQSSSSTNYNTPFQGVTWDHDAWTLTSTNTANTDWHAQSFVANGYIGSSFASTGPFPYLFSASSGQWWMNQYGTFGTVAGFFNREPITLGAVFSNLDQYGWQSVISGLPCWGPMVLDLGNGTYLDATVDVNELSNIVLQQDFRKGSANYAYTWKPSNLNGFAVDVSFVVVADKLHPNRAYVQMNLTSTESTNATLVNILDGLSARRTDFVEKGMNDSYIYTSVSPTGVANVTAWLFSSLDSSEVDMSTLQLATGQPYISNYPSTIAQSVQVNLQPNKTISLTKCVGIASNDAFGNARDVALNEMIAGKNTSFALAFQQHAEEWASLLSGDSVTSFADPVTAEIPSNLMDRQITTIVAASMLLMNTISENATKYVDNAPINVWGISVCGLTSDCYAGQRFWDQDIWMGPYLAATHPFEAKQIALSRTAHYPQALANIESAFMSSSKSQIVFSPHAAIYPWSDGRDGNCTGVAPCWDWEYHINGDIVKGFVNYWAASGDDNFFNSSLLPITNSIATMYSEIIQLNSATNTWVLTHMTDPDEYANNVDNGAFTMALIQWTLRTANFFNGLYGLPQNATWDQQSSAIEIPLDEDADITLEYSGMAGSISVKQADVILRTYPLDNQLNYTINNQLADMAYYAAKQSQGGPGMTYAIFSIDASVLEMSGCSAYTYDTSAWSPYFRGPWYAFSETMVDSGYPAYPFLTGLGGFLQMDLMGYLGLRYGTFYEVQVSPNLPPQIPYVRLPVFYFQGWPIQAVMNQTHTTLTRLETPLPTANSTFSDSSIPVLVSFNASTSGSFELPPLGTLVLTNRQSGANMAISNNILQCRPIISSNGTIIAGQFPEAAIDGSRSTLWQANSGETINSVTVDLTNMTYAPVDYVYINWATAVASNFSIIFHNNSNDMTGMDSVRIDVPNVNISVPYNASQQDVVQQYIGNSTNVSLTDQNLWTGNYATLLVIGNQADESTGASVAEWAVVIGSLGNASDSLAINATSTIRADSYTSHNGTQTQPTSDVGGGDNVGWIHNGEWLGYADVDFGSIGATKFIARVSSGAAAEIIGGVQVTLDSPATSPVGYFNVSNTGGWQSWETMSANISIVTGQHTVYLTFASSQSDDFVNINWFTFGSG